MDTVLQDPAFLHDVKDALRRHDGKLLIRILELLEPWQVSVHLWPLLFQSGRLLLHLALL